MCDNIYQMHLKRHKGLGDSIFILLIHVDGLVEDCSISTVKALEILQSGTKPLMSYYGIVQYSMVVSTPVQWLRESIDHDLDSQKISHTLATRVKLQVSMLKLQTKSTYCDINRLYHTMFTEKLTIHISECHWVS